MINILQSSKDITTNPKKQTVNHINRKMNKLKRTREYKRKQTKTVKKDRRVNKARTVA
jgi:hypothetical protein